ncbi:asparagine synthase-related protein [Streptomyces rubradiris]|uniref:asparagine synthase-related protein n=1 Tax=Streptomyces rubradiris TaxID=285531 RepID=UPI001E5D94E6|nr:asparagine synthase-related protein [Streptomyces rubradiris]
MSEQATSFLDPAPVKESNLADQYRSAANEVTHLPGDSPVERRMRLASYLDITRFLQMMLDREDRMSMATGPEVRVPLCDHRLVEYVHNAPWSVKTFEGREKSLLRHAAKHLLPESIGQRRKAPYPSTQDPGYDEAVNRELSRVAADPGAAPAERRGDPYPPRQAGRHPVLDDAAFRLHGDPRAAERLDGTPRRRSARPVV